MVTKLEDRPGVGRSAQWYSAAEAPRKPHLPMRPVSCGEPQPMEVSSAREEQIPGSPQFHTPIKH